MGNKNYVEFKIVRPLYALVKKISSPTLKIGDRFIYNGHKTLMFKTNVKSIDGKYLCCDEVGVVEWIDGNTKVTKINGVVVALNGFARELKSEYLRQASQ